MKPHFERIKVNMLLQGEGFMRNASSNCNFIGMAKPSLHYYLINRQSTERRNTMKKFVRILFFLAALGILSPLGPTFAKTVKFTFGTTNGSKDFSSLAMVRWQSAMKDASKGELDMNFVQELFL